MTRHTFIAALLLLGACEMPTSFDTDEGAQSSRTATTAQVDALQDQLDAFADLTAAMPACVTDPTLDCVSDRQLDHEVVLLQVETQWQKVRIDELEREIDVLLEAAQ